MPLRSAPWAILRSMRLRLVTPIVMALAICFAPVALDVCHAACVPPATPVSAAPASHDHAHAHHASTSGHTHTAGGPEAVAQDAGPVHVKSLPHSCSHTDELPESAGACSTLLVLSPAVIVTTMDLAVPTLGRLQQSEPPHSAASLRIALTTQLRV